VHGNRLTDFVAVVGAAYLAEVHGADPAESLAAAEAAGLRPSDGANALLAAYCDQPRSAIAAATSSGRSVMT
jgi:hypothetical protein